MNARVWATLAAMCTPLLAGGCDVGQSSNTGLTEPIVVQGGQFIAGELPGTPPLSVDAQAPKGAGTASDAGADAAPQAGFPPLTVIEPITVHSTSIQAGSTLGISGDVSDDTAAVGIRLADMGTGYWVVPTGTPDSQISGALTYGMSTGYNINDPPGLHLLRLVAIGSNGNAGTQADLLVCLNSRIPDNGHACTPEIAPPSAVFTLMWDSNFDLDIHVVTPSGTTYDSKHRLGTILDGGRSIPDNIPFVDRDSMRNCVPDGLRQEDLVFPDGLPKGTYYFFVDPFASCGQNAVHFTLTVYQSTGKCPACNLQQRTQWAGDLLASQATDGLSPPTYVDKLVVQ